MCLYPKLVKNPKYRANKKNGGNVPKVQDPRTTLVPVGCGKCMECRKKKANEWKVRLSEEIRSNRNGQFVSLTFSDEALVELEKEFEGKLEGYDLDNACARLAVRRFTQAWHKRNKKSVKRWLITELGGTRTERLHIHGIIFTEDKQQIENYWKYGNVFIGSYVNEASITYIVKYLTKTDMAHKEYVPKIFCSPGIGKGYLDRDDWKKNKYQGEDTNDLYRFRNGFKTALPIYYRNKIYTEEEREKLWIHKLDLEKRYVNGLCIDISEGENVYYKALKRAREVNKRLGYGDDSVNWERRFYERQRRILKKLERISKIQG